MIKLYYSPMTRSVRPRWLLEELGVPYELVRIDIPGGEGESPAHLARHPLGAVPVLEDDGVTMFESGAICLYLADKFLEKGFAPPHGTPERAPYYQWMFFSQATLEAPLAEVFYETVTRDESERSPIHLERCRAEWQDAAGALARAIEGKEWILGPRFSAADVMLITLLAWARATRLLEGFPALEAYMKRGAARPANKRSRAD